MKPTIVVFIMMVLFFFGGCARVIIEKGGVGEGYDVYRPEPYLLVFTQAVLQGETAPHTEGHTSDTSAASQPANQTQPSTAHADAGTGNGSGDDSKKNPSGGTDSTASIEGLTGPGAMIIWLPNYSERYRVRSSNFLAVSGAQFTIRDGWMLTGITDQSDNTALIQAGASVLSSALGAGSASTGKAKATVVGGQPFTITTQKAQLYKFLFDPDGNFYGMAEVKLDEECLSRIRRQCDCKTRLVPIRSPSYDGRRLEDRSSRDKDSADGSRSGAK